MTETEKQDYIYGKVKFPDHYLARDKVQFPLVKKFEEHYMLSVVPLGNIDFKVEVV